MDNAFWRAVLRFGRRWSQTEGAGLIQDVAAEWVVGLKLAAPRSLFSLNINARFRISTIPKFGSTRNQIDLK